MSYWCAGCQVEHPADDDEERMRCPRCGSVDEDGESADILVEVPTTFSFGPTCQWGQMPDGEESVEEDNIFDEYPARCNNGACDFVGTVGDFRNVVREKAG